MLQRQPDVVEAIQQAVLGERIDVEASFELGADGDGLGLQVDRDLGLRISFCQFE